MASGGEARIMPGSIEVTEEKAQVSQE